MKILHILSQTPDFTGSGKFIQEMIRQSSCKGHDNFLLAGSQKDFHVPATLVGQNQHELVRFDGVELDFAIPGMSDIMPYSSTRFSCMTPQQLSDYKAVFLKKINTVLENYRPDIIHAHHLWIASAMARRAAQDIPMLATCHGTCLRQHHLCPSISLEIKAQLKQIDQVIALSQDQKNLIHSTLGFKSDKISVISGGYNKDIFYTAPKSFDGTVHLLYAGKISTPKGVPWLLKSLEKISHLPFKLHMAGSAAEEEKRYCLSLARSFGDQIQYHGTLTHQQLGDLMRKAHLFILPSFYEGLPLVLMEALACGCRIITTSLPGVHEIFTQAHPYMVKMIDLPELETIDQPYKKDEPALERKLAGLIETSVLEIVDRPVPDEGYIQKAVEEFTWEKIFFKVESVYRQLTRAN